MNLPDPEESFLKELNRFSYNFLWNGKNDKIRRYGVCQAYEVGGLNLTKLTLFSHSFACICEDSGISCKGVRSLQIVFSQGSYCIFLPFFGLLWR